MISLNDVLLAMSNIPVDDPIAEIWGRGLQSGYKIIEYTGSLPITINANGDALIDYRIYGASGGVGEPTENLFDNRTRGYYEWRNGIYINDPLASHWRIPVTEGDIIYANNKDTMGWGCCFYQGEYVPEIRIRPYSFPYTVPAGVDEVTSNYPAGSSAMVTVNQATPTSYVPYGYKLPMVTRTENLFDGQGENNYGYYNSEDGVYYNDRRYKFWRIPVNEGDVIHMTRNGRGSGCAFYNGEYVTSINYQISDYVVPSGVDEITNNYNYSVFNAAMVTKNQPLPETYIPYGYTDTPVYIGEARLDAGEYVSYGEQKIYRDVSGTLTPTDPPVPLPEIPTINGTTIIDYDGDPKPSQMYVKYKGKG